MPVDAPPPPGADQGRRAGLRRRPAPGRVDAAVPDRDGVGRCARGPGRAAAAEVEAKRQGEDQRREGERGVAPPPPARPRHLRPEVKRSRTEIYGAS